MRDHVGAHAGRLLHDGVEAGERQLVARVAEHEADAPRLVRERHRRLDRDEFVGPRRWVEDPWIEGAILGEHIKGRSQYGGPDGTNDDKAESDHPAASYHSVIHSSRVALPF